jgi:transposase
MPPAYVKPYVKRQKNDAADAEAICEAVTRPNMRFVPTKSPEQQSCLSLHRTRHLFIRQQTAIINSIRAHLAEFGIVAPVGRRGVEHLLKVVVDDNDTRLPEIARVCVAAPRLPVRHVCLHGECRRVSGRGAEEKKTTRNDVVDDARSRHRMCQRVIVGQRIT